MKKNGAATNFNLRTKTTKKLLVPQVCPGMQFGGSLKQSNITTVQVCPEINPRRVMQAEKKFEKLLYLSIVAPVLISLNKNTAKTA